MQFISSDTSVWIDFSTIGFLQAPFLLNDQFTYPPFTQFWKMKRISVTGIIRKRHRRIT